MPAFDATSGSSSGTGTLSWTHTPVGTPRGILVFVSQITGSTDEVTSVTYGGVAMSEISGSPLLHVNPTHGDEAGAVYAYFLGSGIPTGAQTVQVNVNGTASTKAAVAYSLTSSFDTVVQNTTTLNTVAANPSATLALSGLTCWVALTGFSGQNAISGTTPLTNWTSVNETDAGNQVFLTYRYNNVSTADVTVGWTQTSEDVAMIAVAIRDVTAIKRFAMAIGA
jgi:hypothetical protein